MNLPFLKYTIHRKALVLGVVCVLVASTMVAQNDSTLVVNTNEVSKIAILKSELEKKPNDVKRQYNLGKAYLEEGNIFLAFPLLEHAAPRLGKEGQLTLAKAYVGLYQFDKANDILDKHFRITKRSKALPEEVENLKSRIKQAEKLLDNTERITVLDSLILPKSSFLSAIKLTPGEGSIKENNGETHGDIPYARFINGVNSVALMAQQAADSSQNSDIFIQNLVGRQWSNPQPLESINTAQNENFAVLKQDGITLIFARENGPDGIGGYDLYMTRRNLNDDTFLAPTLLGMPFNSPYNDYLLIYDENKNLGYLVSDRFCPTDRVCVYTFRPNEKIIQVPSDDHAVKALWASWMNIKATQDTESDELTTAPQTVATTTPPKRKDFMFILGDGRTYTNFEDFTVPRAQALYKEAFRIEKEISELKNELQKLRLQYAKGDNSERSNLRTPILSKETILQQKELQLQSLLKEVRNTELTK